MNQEVGAMLRTEDIYGLLLTYERQNRLITQVSASDPLLKVNFGYTIHGQMRFQFSLQKGRLHGPGRMWYANGQMQEEMPFHKGILHGVLMSWYSDGQIQSEVSYLNGQFHGQRREWYVSGRQKSECFYHLNLLEGLLTEWYPNGLIKEQVNFREGVRHGLWKEYDQTGKLITQKLFVRGVHLDGQVQRLLESGRLNAGHILRMRNTAVRRICLEELGYARFLAGVAHEIIDLEGSQELVRIDWHKDEEPIYLVKVRCPSTGAYYTLRVPPHMDSVQQAVAWTFGLQEEEYLPQEES